MLRILFGLEGRIGRRNYWLAIFAQLAILIGLFFAFGTALVAMAAAIGFDMTPGATPPSAENLTPEQTLFASGAGIGAIIFIVIVILLSFYMSIAAQVKRLHDLNLSGWLAVISMLGGPIALALVSTSAVGGPIALVIGLAQLGLGLMCGFFPGTKGPNKYADDPISIFDVQDRGNETWADRAQAHRNSLRAQQEASREEGPQRGGSADDGEERPRRKKRTPPSGGGGRGGFGKRGLA